MRNRQIIDLPATMADESHSRNKLKNPILDLKVQDIKYLHFHREFELGLCFSGGGVIFHCDAEIPFSEGDVQIVYPYMRHMHTASERERCKWVWAYIDAESLMEALKIQDISRVEELVKSTGAVSGIVDKERFPELHMKLTDFALRSSGEGFADRERMAIDFYSILLSAADAAKKCGGDSEGLSGRISILQPALCRITEDMENGGNTSVEELSRLCSMSVSGFRRVFSELMGAPPKVYIRACRIRRAKQLLRRGEMNILDIAFSVGYKDISGFNRSFIETTGETPSAYRKRHR